MLYRPLEIEEVVELEEKLEGIFKEELLKILLNLNRNERLGDFLNLIGYSKLIEKNDNGFVSLTDQKIIILGDSQIRANDIIKTIKECGIAKNRVELHLDYHLDGFNIDTLKYSFKYSLILIGPMPHSMEGKDSYSSVITRLVTEDGFPPVKQLRAGGELKITKTSVRTAIYEALENGVIT